MDPAPSDMLRLTADIAPAARPVEPPVPIKKSLFLDYIVCLEDGKTLKMLRRHLQTSSAMTVDDYRAEWDLLPSYRMVAPNYARHRSPLAKKIGLGRKREVAPAEPAVQEVPKGVSARKRSVKADA